MKQLVVCSDLSDLVIEQAKANFGKLGPKYGKDVQAIAGALASAASEVVATLRSGQAVALDVDGKTYDIEPGDVQIDAQEDPDWLTAEDRDLRLALCTKLTPELEREGMSRDVVRHIQQLRKEAGLEIQDRIEVRWETDDAELARAIEEWADYIKAETLCDALQRGMPAEEETGRHGKQVRIGKAVLHLELRKL